MDQPHRGQSNGSPHTVQSGRAVGLKRARTLLLGASASLAIAACDAADAADAADTADTADTGSRAAAPAPAPARAVHPSQDTVKRKPTPDSGARPVDSTSAARWPVAGPVPLPGSLLPATRIVAYYGNPFSRRMGILGALPPDSMLARLEKQALEYADADTLTPVVLALELVATVAQAGPGADGLYRARMPDSLIERVASWAERSGAILILDIQIGHSTTAAEIAPYMKYLRRPYVHLGIDPEFDMPKGKKPGGVIGTTDATDINLAIDSLAALVSRDSLPPKVLIVHRFTRRMLTRSAAIKLDPRVQVVIDMDGFGPPRLKRQSYAAYVESEPVQFAGIKLFYRNDKPLMTAAEVLRLHPVPFFVMYQ